MRMYLRRGVNRALAAGSAVVVGVGLMVAAAPAASAAVVPTAANAAPAVAAPAAPDCASVPWGSKVKKKKPRSLTSAPVTNVRGATHRCYDRVVIDLGQGKKTGYRVKYVKTVRQDGSGKKVDLKGGAALQVIVGAAAYDVDTGDATFTPKKPNKLVKTKGFHSVKQVAFAGSFEGQTTIGIGVRAKLPFTASVLKGPGKNQRLVIDIARNW